MFLPEYVEVYGINNFDESMAAFEFVTVFSSAEFAVRPFLIKYPEKMMKQMLAWSKHKEPMVRRLASEGSRPRLPWAMAVGYLKKDPKPILPILENLKNDPSETVRRSVANNLNDIAKDHPDVVLSLAKKWIGKNANTDALLKHACRTLLKAGNKTALHLFDVGGDHDITLSNMGISRASIRIGDSIDLSFTISNNEKKPVSLRVEYAIDFIKAKGTSRKVFKVSEGSFASNTAKEFKRKLRFTDLTTRIHYPGEHRITLVINGTEKESIFVELRTP
jgi:3-methyladenine DNA glycosylase AlkC